MMKPKTIFILALCVTVLAVVSATTYIYDTQIITPLLNVTGNSIYVHPTTNDHAYIQIQAGGAKDGFIKFWNGTEQWWIQYDQSDDTLEFNNRDIPNPVLTLGYGGVDSYSYFLGGISVLNITDRTPSPSSKIDVLDDLRDSKGIAQDCGAGDVCEVNKEKLPKHLKTTLCDKETGECEVVRDLSTTVSELWLQNQKQQELIDDLLDRIEELERAK